MTGGVVEVEVDGEYKHFSSKNYTFPYFIDDVFSGWSHQSRIEIEPVNKFEQISIVCILGDDKKTIIDFEVNYRDRYVRQSGVAASDVFLKSDPENPIVFKNIHQNDNYVYGEFEGTLTLEPLEFKSKTFKNGKFKVPLFRVEPDTKW